MTQESLSLRCEGLVVVPDNGKWERVKEMRRHFSTLCKTTHLCSWNQDVLRQWFGSWKNVSKALPNSGNVFSLQTCLNGRNQFLKVISELKEIQAAAVCCQRKNDIERWVLKLLYLILNPLFSSVQFSCSVMSNSLQPHGLQHARLPCPSPTPGALSNSSPLSHWCHPTISSSVVPFSPHLQSFPASGSFPMSQVFTSGGQSIGASASASVLPMNIQDWFPLRWTGLISLQSKGLSRVFSNTTVQKHQFFGPQFSL